MCEKAKEIQKLWKPIIGDNFCHKIIMKHTHADIVVNYSKGDNYYNSGVTGLRFKLAITSSNWLPRQDQLQKMLDFGGNPEWWPKLNVLKQFADKTWQTSNVKSYQMPYRTMEQLWLALVMKNKYNKTWDKEEWKHGA